MIVTLTLWLLWKADPGVLVCAAFWLRVVWILDSKRVTRYPAGAIVLLGVVLNATVTELNGGVMPVVGMPTYFQAASPSGKRRRRVTTCSYWRTAHRFTSSALAISR